jgi:hypothetical protein
MLPFLSASALALNPPNLKSLWKEGKAMRPPPNPWGRVSDQSM